VSALPICHHPGLLVCCRLAVQTPEQHHEVCPAESPAAVSLCCLAAGQLIVSLGLDRERQPSLYLDELAITVDQSSLACILVTEQAESAGFLCTLCQCSIFIAVNPQVPSIPWRFSQQEKLAASMPHRAAELLSCCPASKAPEPRLFPLLSRIAQQCTRGKKKSYGTSSPLIF
jgi:hypothetical protein